MTISYDNIADAAYFKLSDSKIASTQKVEDKLVVDSDAEGNIVGIEILNLSSN